MNISNKTSFLKVFSYTIFAILLYWLLLSVFADKSDPVSSLITHSLCAFFTTIVYSQILLKSHKYTIFIAAVFVLKTTIGLAHYLYFINPNYFSQPSLVMLHGEYQVSFASICNFADAKGQLGLFIMPENILLIPHSELLNLVSFVFYRAGNYVLTIMPLNTLCSLMTAVLLTYIVQLRRGNAFMVLFLVSLYPFTLVTSFFCRDMVGMFLITFGLLTVVLSKRVQWIFLIITSYMCYMQRTPYVIIPFFAYIIEYFLMIKSRSNISIFKKIIFVVFSIIGLFIIVPIITTVLEENQMYTTIFSNMVAMIFFPIKYLLGIVGPFPWITWKDSIEGAYYFNSIILAIAMWVVTLKGFPILFKMLKKNEPIDFITLCGLLLIIFGAFNSFANVAYIGWGLPFLVPFISERWTLKNILTLSAKIFLVFIIINILYVAAGLTGSNITNIFKQS